MNPNETPETLFDKAWLKVPADAQRESLSLAQAKALEVCAIVTLFSCVAGVGLDIQVIPLCVLATLPLLFQVVTKRALLEIKPKIAARYLVANQTASRYGQALGVAEPTPKAVFCGSLETISDSETGGAQELDLELEIGTEGETPPRKDVWISLFADSLIMFSENRGGAHLEFSRSILRDISFNLDADEITNEEDATKEPRLVIEALDPQGAEKRWIVTSRHRSALISCERKIRFFTKLAKEQHGLIPQGA